MVTLMPGSERLTDSELVLDRDNLTLREVNRALRGLPPGGRARVVNPRGRHNLAVGLDAGVAVDIDGAAGYYVGGLGKHATVTVHGRAGWGVGENLMSGGVRVLGDAGQSVASSAHGGTVVVEGDCSLRTAISLKGATVVVSGDVGAYCAFMAQAGTVLVGGNTGPALGDSLYEAVIYVAGRVKSLGTDARIEELRTEDVALVRALVAAHGLDHVDPENVTRVASARELYHFDTHHAGAY